MIVIVEPGCYALNMTLKENHGRVDFSFNLQGAGKAINLNFFFYLLFVIMIICQVPVQADG